MWYLNPEKREYTCYRNWDDVGFEVDFGVCMKFGLGENMG